MIPEAKTDGNIWICLFSLRLIVKKEKPKAEIIADKFPFQSPPPKSSQIKVPKMPKSQKTNPKIIKNQTDQQHRQNPTSQIAKVSKLGGTCESCKMKAEN